MLYISSTTSTRHRQCGFTLVEVMVAMVIGMLGIIIMMQMFSVFEGQKRTTGGGNDAQTAGALAMFDIQKNIQQAGYCFAATSAASATALAPTLGGTALRPVMIDFGTLLAPDANTNTIMISYGNDSCAPQSASGAVSAATMNIVAYAVRNGSLWQCNNIANTCNNAANWVEIASNIVSMRAQCNANQGVQVALVARNSQLEKTAVTTVFPTWSGATTINLAATPVDATATALATRDGLQNWQYYRYKVIETLAPIRNTLWTGAPGC